MGAGSGFPSSTRTGFRTAHAPFGLRVTPGSDRLRPLAAYR